MKNKKRESFNIKKEYKESWEYIKESKNYIFSIIGLFLIMAVIGFVFEAPESVSDRVREYVSEILEQTEGMSQIGLIGFIFWNNLKIGFMGIIFGIAFGIFPLLTTIGNGYIIGFVSKLAVGKEGFSSLWGLVPHGIFELPAIFISLGLGIKLGSFVFQKDIKKSFIEYFNKSLRVFFFIILPLLLIAAIIEGSLIALSS